MNRHHTPRLRPFGPSRYLVTLALALAIGGWRWSPVAAGPQAAAPQQPTDVELVIRGDGGSPPRYAVPEFAAATADLAAAAKEIGPVLWDDLNFEHEVALIPRDVAATISIARAADQVPFASWREVGADAVVFGLVQRSGGNITVQVRLFNVASRRQVFGQEYTLPAGNPRQFAHQIADDIHKQQRNLRGVARSKIAFVSNRTRQRLAGTVQQNRDVKEIWIADYDGANQRRVTITADLNLNPSWSPDGRAIAYSSHRRVSTGGQVEILLSYIYQGLLETPTKGIGNSYVPAYSPDGSRIAFSSSRDDNAELYVMNRDGSGARRLTNHPASDTTPTWSPSGEQIAFISDRTGNPQLYIMNADGSGLRRVPVPDNYVDRPTWAPPPYNEIAYSARVGGGFDIHVHELATGSTRRITFGEGSNESPSYSANGRHVAFVSSRLGGRYQLFTIGRDGKGLKQLTRDGDNQTPAWSN
jgi:TolB protein